MAATSDSALCSGQNNELPVFGTCPAGVAGTTRLLVFRLFFGFAVCFLRGRMDIFSEKSLGSNHRDDSPILDRLAGRFTGFSIIVDCRVERKR